MAIAENTGLPATYSPPTATMTATPDTSTECPAVRAATRIASTSP